MEISSGSFLFLGNDTKYTFEENAPLKAGFVIAEINNNFILSENKKISKEEKKEIKNKNKEIIKLAERDASIWYNMKILNNSYNPTIQKYIEDKNILL